MLECITGYGNCDDCEHYDHSDGSCNAIYKLEDELNDNGN